MQMMMKTPMRAVAMARLKPNPPSRTGLSRKSSSDAERTIREIGHGGPGRRRSDDRRPIKQRLKFLRGDLQVHQGDQQRDKQRRAGKVTPIQRHGHRVAAGFAKRRGGDLDDPENERDFGNLACVSFSRDCHKTFLFQCRRGDGAAAFSTLLLLSS
jgi:hypothetical protein